MAIAVFVLGSAASGKSSVVRERYVGTLDLYEADESRVDHPRTGFSLDRWYDADQEKRAVPLYTDQEGDEESRRRFSKPGLGGPAGPKTLEELTEYPQAVREALQTYIEALGFSSPENFARELLMEPDEAGPLHFRRGLTHELSKYVAAAKFEEQLKIGPESGSVVWDATGNTDDYVYWIEIALQAGYDVEILYVTCPLPVALKRAAERKRRLPPSEIRRTYEKAAKTADDLEIIAGTHPFSEHITFERVPTSSEGEEMQALQAGYGESST